MYVTINTSNKNIFKTSNNTPKSKAVDDTVIKKRKEIQAKHQDYIIKDFSNIFLSKYKKYTAILVFDFLTSPLETCDIPIAFKHLIKNMK